MRPTRAQVGQDGPLPVSASVSVPLPKPPSHSTGPRQHNTHAHCAASGALHGLKPLRNVQQFQLGQAAKAARRFLQRAHQDQRWGLRGGRQWMPLVPPNTTTCADRPTDPPSWRRCTPACAPKSPRTGVEGAPGTLAKGPKGPTHKEAQHTTGVTEGAGNMSTGPSGSATAVGVTARLG
jgi:hypothetical protein